MAVAKAIGHPVPTLLTSALLERVDILDAFPVLSSRSTPACFINGSARTLMPLFHSAGNSP